MTGRRVEQQLMRRAAILATTRAQIAERGYHGVTMRDLARACNVTVATLYNQFGSKEQLFSLSADELFRAHALRAQSRPVEPGLGRLLSVVGLPVEIYEQSPEYCRAILIGAEPSDAESATGFGVRSALRLELLQALRELRDQGQLDPRVDLAALAEVMGDEFMALNRRWARGTNSLGWLRARRLFAVALILRGVTSGRAREALAVHLYRLEEEHDRGGDTLDIAASAAS